MIQYYKQVEILPKELAVGNTVYSCTFFKEINSNGTSHVLEVQLAEAAEYIDCISAER